ncbi:MAG: MarR family winged helix-turn-helix transcriptional regulator [Lachnospiraceae bacterium]|nr:MarR family winged helix-turn-helix transcriptional regulator [Lachnospiraceae bacterium]
MAIENLGLEIRILANMIYNRANQITMKAENLSIHQCWILQYLLETAEKTVYQKDIEQLFSIKRSTANQMLRALEMRNYIQRTVSAEDARKNVLTVTEAGAGAYRRLSKDLYQLMLKLHGDIPGDELAQFQSTLRKLWHNMEQEEKKTEIPLIS